MQAQRKRGRPLDEQARARKREDILACAAGVFARRGYPGTDMQAVADEAGIAKGTIYLYFPSKEELFLAAVDQGMTSLRSEVDSAIASLADPLDIIAGAIRAYLRFFKNHPEQVELLILERAEFRDRKRSTYHDHREAGRPRWNRLVSDLVSSGRLREMPVSRVMDVVGDLLYGTMFTNHFSGGTKALEEQAGDILDIIYHGMLSDRERDRIAPGGKRGKR